MHLQTVSFAVGHFELRKAFNPFVDEMILEQLLHID